MRQWHLLFTVLLASPALTACFEFDGFGDDWDDDDDYCVGCEWYDYESNECWIDGMGSTTCDDAEAMGCTCYDGYCYACTAMPENCWCDDWGYCQCVDLAGGGCMSNADCAAGEVCSLHEYCAPIVGNCPLTDECLADPGTYTHEWQGIDPWYAGELSLGEDAGLMRVDFEFYSDHLYGEGDIYVGGDHLSVVFTGIREETLLQGQFLDALGGRSYDAYFEAELLSASEIAGQLWFADDGGERSGAFHLYRTSACGCSAVAECADASDCGSRERCEGGFCVPSTEPQDPVLATGCARNLDCRGGELCIDASCVAICLSSAECGEGEICVGGSCVAGCAADADCAEGAGCVAGACVPLADCGGACAADESCVDGQCLRACDTHCDCDGGEACLNGLCTPGTAGVCPRG